MPHINQSRHLNIPNKFTVTRCKIAFSAILHTQSLQQIIAIIIPATEEGLGEQKISIGRGWDWHRSRLRNYHFPSIKNQMRRRNIELNKNLFVHQFHLSVEVTGAIISRAIVRTQVMHTVNMR
ncbi:hypothetical protein ACH5A7_39935, partial [Streptomyces sp. NPDC018955]|uniref:hypothetical protein n=1 Tax=Streptomyces sp. NPDC018955 TaxID=3365055 RepID=UPI00378A367B